MCCNGLYNLLHCIKAVLQTNFYMTIKNNNYVVFLLCFSLILDNAKNQVNVKVDTLQDANIKNEIIT